MNLGFRLLTRIFRKRVAQETRHHLATIIRDQSQGSRHRASALLRRLGDESGPHVVIGKTQEGETISIPITRLAASWGVITGGTGSGKSMVATAVIEAFLSAVEADTSLGLLDAKGETFERAVFLIARVLETLPLEAAERLRARLVIIDFAAQDPITAYNVAAPWSGTDLDYFASSRTETLQELFPSGDGISIRGGSLLKHVIKLLAEQRVPFGYIDELLSSEALRSRLIAGSKDDELRRYFQVHFRSEPRATISAVHARLNATLFSSASLKLALSGTTAPDFRALMDTGAIVLVNCAGANISRATARTLQSIVLSDIRHGVFNRKERTAYLWVCDEAQNLFRTKYLKEHMTDLLCTSRSFGVHGLLITQNLANAVQDSETIEAIHTNTKWAMVLRGSVKDAAFLQSALPTSGRREKPRFNLYAPAEFYSASEERNIVLQEVAHLPDREGWLWMKSLTGEAFRLRTRTVDIPAAPRFQEVVKRILRDPAAGRRCSRAAYLEEIERDDAVWRTTPVEKAGRDLIDSLTELYHGGEEKNQ